MEPSQEALHDALSRVIDPELRKPVTELDMVRGIVVDGGDVTVTIALTVVGCPLRNSFQEQVAREVGAVAGVTSVRLEFDVMSPDERVALTTKLRGGRPAEDRTIQLEPTTRVIAVASGKGGVGKSSLTVNLAAAFAQLGREVGVLDADVYGHSIPHMLGIRQKPVLVDRLMIPPVKHDLKLMSIGFFLDDNQPVMWRGPMLHKALEQFLCDVHWGELDVLVVDMPPGTGDVSISLGQLLPRAEAVVVTTPQPLAQEVAVRAAEMAQKTGMQLLGVIENMTSEVFGYGGGERLAAQLGVPLLGTVPLDVRVRESGDGGEPLVSGRPGLGAGAGDLRDRARARREPRRRLHEDAAACLLRSGSRRSASRRGCRGPRRALPRRGGVGPHRPWAAADRVARDLARADDRRQPAASRLGAGLRALGRQRRARLPRPARRSSRRSSPTRRRARGSSSPAARSRPACSATGRGGSPRAGSSRR